MLKDISYLRHLPRPGEVDDESQPAHLNHLASKGNKLDQNEHHWLELTHITHTDHTVVHDEQYQQHHHREPIISIVKEEVPDSDTEGANLKPAPAEGLIDLIKQQGKDQDRSTTTQDPIALRLENPMGQLQSSSKALVSEESNFNAKRLRLKGDSDRTMESEEFDTEIINEKIQVHSKNIY